MGSYITQTGLWKIMQSIKRKIFVSYHHDSDRYFYDFLSQTFHDRFEVIYDNSVEREIDSEDPNYVMRRIRENYVIGSSCTVVLVGAKTHGRKYVDWEICTTLEKQHGLIGVKLPSVPVNPNNTVTVPARLHDNIQSGFALWIAWDQLFQAPTAMANLIEEANRRPKQLIRNSRPRMARNAS